MAIHLSAKQRVLDLGRRQLRPELPVRGDDGADLFVFVCFWFVYIGSDGSRSYIRPHTNRTKQYAQKPRTYRLRKRLLPPGLGAPELIGGIDPRRVSLLHLAPLAEEERSQRVEGFGPGALLAGEGDGGLV